MIQKITPLLLGLIVVGCITACEIKKDKPLIGEIRPSKEAIIKNQRDERRQDEKTPGKEEENTRGIDLTTLVDNHKGQILLRTGYVASYNPKTKLPNWVAWKLSRDHTAGKFKRQGIKYTEDQDVPLPRATNIDYYNSGYDRGHMCPSGDNKWSSRAQEECFLLTNICPQAHRLNSGAWNDLEQQCRKWARQFGSIYIICGPIFNREDGKTIGKNTVRVPDAFFKIVFRIDEGTAQSIAFIYNNDDEEDSLSTYLRPLSEIEGATGFSFFKALPEKLRRELHGNQALGNWE